MFRIRANIAHICGVALMLLTACTVAVDDKSGLTIGVNLEPPNLDPTSGAAAAIDEIVYANLFEGLTRIDRFGQVQPALAQSWNISGDQLIYEFKLREGVRFHDGTSFDATDVKFSLDRARAKGSTNAQPGLFSMIDQVKVTDKSHVKIILKRRAADFLFNMAWGDAVIVAPETAFENTSNPIGTGPFKFERWQKGQAIKLRRNPDYWGEDAKLDWILFKFIPDNVAAYAALIAGDVNGFANFPAAELLPLLTKNDRFKVKIGVTEGETMMGMNNKKPPFNNLAVRQAILHAIDRKSIIKGAMFGQGTPIGSFFSPLHPDYIDLVDTYDFNPQKAKELLSDAGYPDGFETSIKIPPTNYARRSGEIIAAQLAVVGINAKIEYMEWAQWLDQVLGNKAYDMTIVSHTEPRDISFFARDDNYIGYDNPSFQKLMVEIEQARNTEERKRLHHAAQGLLADEAVSAFLFQLPQIGVWEVDINGYWENAPIQAIDMTSVTHGP